MKARQLIGNATYGPEALKAITQAFDDAWSEIGQNVSSRPAAIETARLRLANIILGLAQEDTRDPAPLKEEAVRRYLSKGQV